MTSGDKRQIERFLLDDMPDEEREKFEELMLGDDDLLYEVQDAENSLVDRYVSGGLSGAELERFERSLERMPSRRSKAANAAALRTLIDAERVKVPAAAEPDSLWAKITAAFSSPAVGFSMAGLIVILAAAAIFLLIDNNRKAAEVARLADEVDSAQRSGRLSELERQIAASLAAEAELQRQIDGEKGVTADLTADLEQARENSRRLEAEVADLRNRRPDSAPAPRPNNGTVEAPVIAALILRPAGTRGGGTKVFSLSDNLNIKRISVLLTLPANTGSDERLDVRLNGKPIARNLKVSIQPSGGKSLAVTVARSALAVGENTLTVTAGEKEIAAYELTAENDR
jgi:hypothetical protein